MTGPPDVAVLIDAWRLGAWYSELAVLRLCGFTGLYRNQLSDNTWTGAVEPVPWRQAVLPQALAAAATTPSVTPPGLGRQTSPTA